MYKTEETGSSDNNNDNHKKNIQLSLHLKYDQQIKLDLLTQYGQPISYYKFSIFYQMSGWI